MCYTVFRNESTGAADAAEGSADMATAAPVTSAFKRSKLIAAACAIGLPPIFRRDRMELRRIDPDAAGEIYENYMREAFPESELKPWAMMKELYERGEYDFVAAFEGDQLCGYAWQYAPCGGDAILIDYFSVLPELRCRGIGGQFLRALREFYAPSDKLLLLESEYPGEATDPDMAMRRLGFYKRCGMVDTGVQVRLFDVRFCIFASHETHLAGQMMDALYRGMLPPQFYPSRIQFL